MKHKCPLNQKIYLPEYFNGVVGRTFQKESEQRILYWEFDNALTDTVKLQIEILLTITSANLGTVRIHHIYIKAFLRGVEENGKKITEIDNDLIERYLNTLSMSSITPQSYNNKLQIITTFLHYLQVTGYIKEFNDRIALYYKKSYPIVNEIENLDQKLELLTFHLGKFPAELQIMSFILLFTGIKKSQLFHLKNADFFCKDGNSWMRVPDTFRSVPVPELLHWLVLKYSDRNCIPVESLLFLNKGRKFTAEGFQKAIMKQCRKVGILANEYVFKGNGYRKELCKAFYRNGVSVQVIRDYMGYQTDDMVKKNIGLIEEELVEKSMEYYAETEHSLGGHLLMEKYDKMNEVNHQESRRKMELAVEMIQKTVLEGKRLSVTELSENTGLSRGFFYKNEEVRSVLDEEREKRDQSKIAQIKREVCEKRMEKQIEIYQVELNKLVTENEELKKENLMLKKKLEKLSMRRKT